MPRVAAIAVRTPWGDAQRTLAALTTGGGPEAPLAGDLLADLLDLGRTALAGTRPDLVLLATTKGDLPAWCADLLAEPGCGRGGPAALAAALAAGFAAPGCAVSAACASGTTALGMAARRIASGRMRRVLVLGGDRLDPFVRDGFAALRALDPRGARPFAADRAGLALGETRSAVVLDDQPGGLRLAGWGMRLDAHHLTGPDRNGTGLAAAGRAALARAGIERPALVVAHGTGTRYNDDAESLAYATLCPGVPVTAFKGLLGHSLGACGLTEAALIARASGSVPGVAATALVGCAAPLRLLPAGAHQIPGPVLVANAGFGGINAAVVLAAAEPERALARPKRALVAGEAWLDAAGWSARVADAERGAAWLEPGSDGRLPRLGAREILGRSDPGWGRMDAACRALVALGLRLGPLPTDTVVVLVTESGCAATDRAYERDRRSHGADAQRFVYTLPTAAIGEASIRLGLRGGGFALLGADPPLVEAIVDDLLADGAPAVLVAWIETDRGPHRAEARLLRPA
jgi:hypothetical protein